ncbi:MAG: tetratricopeptide repeat protein [Planctomycetes bacterium]|nr:tetratricopeptide repeat protein [Planctomycetota bacterium]
MAASERASSRSDSTAQLCHDRQSSPARLHRRLLGDLDNILLRALRKEPDRRYSSVEQFSEDVRRHLVGLPVIARNDTLMYLASKFIRRRKGVVVAATLVLLSLLGGFFGIVREAKITADQRDIAQANLQRARTAEARLVDEAATARTSARQAEMINTFLRSMLAAANPYEQGRDVTMIEVLDRAAARVGAELSVEPAVEAAVRRTIGNTYRSLGAYDKAEKHLQAAVAIHQQDYTRNELATNDLARSLIGLAGVLQDRGDYTGAELLYRRALEVYRGLRGDDHLDVIGTMTSLALLLRAKGDEKEADALLRQASERYVRSPRAETREEVDVGGPTSHSHLALLLRYQGDWDGAERLLRQSLAEQHRLYGPQHPRTGDSAAALASFLQEKGDYAAAAEYHRQALAIRRNVPGGAHKLVADSLSALAALSIEQGDYAEAEELLRQALELRERDFDPSHPEIARTMIALGMVLLEQGIPADAEPILRECLEIRRQALPEDDWRIATTESLLGECLTSSEQYEEAEILLLDALAKLETECGAADERTLEALRRIIALYESWGQPERAARYRTRLD